MVIYLDEHIHFRVMGCRDIWRLKLHNATNWGQQGRRAWGGWCTLLILRWWNSYQDHLVFKISHLNHTPSTSALTLLEEKEKRPLGKSVSETPWTWMCWFDPHFNLMSQFVAPDGSIPEQSAGGRCGTWKHIICFQLLVWCYQTIKLMASHKKSEVGCIWHGIYTKHHGLGI